MRGRGSKAGCGSREGLVIESLSGLLAICVSCKGISTEVTRVKGAPLASSRSVGREFLYTALTLLKAD